MKYVLIILLQKYGLVVEFQSLEACKLAENAVRSRVYSASCAPIGEPIPAFEVKGYPKQDIKAKRKPRRKRTAAKRYWSDGQ